MDATDAAPAHVAASSDGAPAENERELTPPPPTVQSEDMPALAALRASLGQRASACTLPTVDGTSSASATATGTHAANVDGKRATPAACVSSAAALDGDAGVGGIEARCLALEAAVASLTAQVAHGVEALAISAAAARIAAAAATLLAQHAQPPLAAGARPATARDALATRSAPLAKRVHAISTPARTDASTAAPRRPRSSMLSSSARPPRPAVSAASASTARARPPPRQPPQPRAAQQRAPPPAHLPAAAEGALAWDDPRPLQAARAHAAREPPRRDDRLLLGASWDEGARVAGARAVLAPAHALDATALVAALSCGGSVAAGVWRESRDAQLRRAEAHYFKIDWFADSSHALREASSLPGPASYRPLPAKASFNVRYTRDAERPSVGDSARAPLAKALVARASAPRPERICPATIPAASVGKE
jgi:hypothetical protein